MVWGHLPHITPSSLTSFSRFKARMSVFSAGPPNLYLHRTLLPYASLPCVLGLLLCLPLRTWKIPLCLSWLGGKAFQVASSHLQAHTNWIWIYRSLGSVLQRFTCLLSMNTAENLLLAVLVYWEGSSGVGFWPIFSRPRYVCLKVSSKVFVLAQDGHLTQWQRKRAKQKSRGKDTLCLEIAKM